MNPIIKTYIAGGVIAAKTQVKFSADNTVVAASAATDLVIGVADLGADASGDRVDVTLHGPASVKAGGTIARGTLFTSDSNGKAVACAPSAGTKANAIGVALVTTADGDEFDALITGPQVVTTPA